MNQNMAVRPGSGEDSRRMKQIATGLGIKPSALEPVTAGLEAGLDTGQLFYPELFMNPHQADEFDALVNGWTFW